ncbi:MAG TPA: methyltransferase MtaB domain-containing protein, partial [Anaerolineaceae bacterium]|nr:methyltransferase MtaB domain-containing protein [Anaerolineaceae bacterium]
ALALRDLFVESDSTLDVQAYVLRPDVVLEISRQIIQESTAYLRTRAAARVALAHLRKASEDQQITLSRVELRWLDTLSKQADQLPESEEEFIDQMKRQIDVSKVNLSEYDL